MEKKIVNALNAINAGKNYPIDERVVWTYFYTYQKKQIDNVGMVTKNFWPFQAVMYAVDMYKTAQGWEESARKAAWLKELSMTLNIAFKWLRNELLIGTEYTDKKSNYKVFRAPISEKEAAGAPKVSAICVRAGRKTINRARKMFFASLSQQEMAKSHELSEEELLTLDNVMAFCKVMEKVGRMSQEGTIDSTKSGDAPKILQYVVKTEAGKNGMREVTLMEALSRVTLLSRKSEKFGVQLNFEAGEVEVNHNKRISYQEKNRYVIADMLDKIRINGLDNAIPVDVSEKVFAVKQALSDEQMAICSRLAEQSAHSDAIRVLMNIYRNLRDTQKADMRQAVKDAGKNEEAQKAGIAVAKEQTKVAYNALSNTVRSLVKGMSHEQLIQLVLGVTFKYMGKDAKRPSSFAGIILAEEFFEYIMSLYSENEEFALTRDELAACDAEDGEVVEFVGGVVPGRAIFSQERNAIPDGVYTVRKNGKHAWVEASVRDRIEARLNDAYNPEELIFQTGTIATEKEADALLDAINGANEVVLASRMHNPNGGKDLFDVVLADGKAVAHYQTKVKNMVKNDKGELVTNKVNGKDDYTISQALRKFYSGKTGEVAFAHKLSFGEGNKTQYAVIVVLKGTKQMRANAVVKAAAEAVVSADFGVEKKATPKASVNSRLAALKAKAADSEKEEAPAQPEEAKEAPQLTLMQRLMAKRNKVAEKPAVTEKKPSRLARLRKAGASIQ